MAILCPLVGVICLSLAPVLAYPLESDNSKTGYVSVRHPKSLDPRSDLVFQEHSLATNNKNEDFSNVRFKERKAIKRYNSPSFIPHERTDHRRLEVVPSTLFKKNELNEAMENQLMYNSEVLSLSNQRRGLHSSDVIQAMPRERINHRRVEAVKGHTTINKKNAQNQSHENHYFHKTEALSNQRPHQRTHISDGMQAMLIAKGKMDYVRKFIENHQDILQTKTYDKPNYLAVNVHKAQVTTAPLSLNVRGNYQTKTMTDQNQKVQAVLVADKPIQAKIHVADSDGSKADGRSQGSNENEISFRECAKREAQISRAFKDPNHGFSDSLKRYISLKDKSTMAPKNNRVQVPIGIRTDSIEENMPVENPYALFYKKYQNLDDGGLIPASSGDAPGYVENDLNLFRSKNNHLSANYETKNPNRVMKKFFSFNKNKYY